MCPLYALKQPATTESSTRATLKAHSDQTDPRMRDIGSALRVFPLRAPSTNHWILYGGNMICHYIARMSAWFEVWLSPVGRGVCAVRAESGCPCAASLSSEPSDEHLGCAHWASMIAVSFKCRCQILRRVNKGTISASFYLLCSIPAPCSPRDLCVRARCCLVVGVSDQDYAGHRDAERGHRTLM